MERTLKRVGQARVVLAGQFFAEGVDPTVWVELAKAQIVDTLNADTTILVLGQGPEAERAEEEVRRLNVHGASIETVLLPELGSKLFLHLLVTDVGRFNECILDLRRRVATMGVQTLSMNGADFQSLDLSGARLRNSMLDNVVKVDGANFSKSTARNAGFPQMEAVRFAEATLAASDFVRIQSCDFTNADLAGCIFVGHCNATSFNKANLQSSTALRVKYSGHTSFENAMLRNARVSTCWFEGCSMKHANFSNAIVWRCEFLGGDLSSTNFAGSILDDSKFVDVDLTGSNFRNASLVGVTFQNCTLTGADFTGARLAGIDLSGVDVSKATGIESVQAEIDTVSCVEMRELADLAKQSKKLVLEVCVKFYSLELQITCTCSNDGAYMVGEFSSKGNWVPSTLTQDIVTRLQGTPLFSASLEGESCLSSVMTAIGKRLKGAELMVDSISVTSSKCPASNKKLKDLATVAWGTTFGAEPPSSEQLAQKAQKVREKRAAKANERDELLELLKQGKAGVLQWNKLFPRCSSRLFKKSVLCDLSLDHLCLSSADFSNSSFDRSSLRNGDLSGTTLRGASFHKCMLQAAQLTSVDASQASLRDANLEEANLEMGSFQEADLRGASLVGAKLFCANLKGANLEGADMSDCRTGDTKYDEHTKFPKDFQVCDGWVWAGTGIDSQITAAVTAAGPLDFAGFVASVRGSVGDWLVDTALKMLKQKKISIYGDPADDAICGMVESQTDKDLIYACRIDANGDFSCCSQNLRPCGGLQGSLCKHIIVLVFGLVMNKRVSTAEALARILASRARKPELHKEVMREVFRHCTAANTGELDWRPCELVAEDYYGL